MMLPYSSFSINTTTMWARRGAGVGVAEWVGAVRSGVVGREERASPGVPAEPGGDGVAPGDPEVAVGVGGVEAVVVGVCGPAPAAFRRSPACLGEQPDASRVRATARAVPRGLRFGFRPVATSREDRRISLGVRASGS